MRSSSKSSVFPFSSYKKQKYLIYIGCISRYLEHLLSPSLSTLSFVFLSASARFHQDALTRGTIVFIPRLVLPLFSPTLTLTV